MEVGPPVSISPLAVVGVPIPVVGNHMVAGDSGVEPLISLYLVLVSLHRQGLLLPPGKQLCVSAVLPMIPQLPCASSRCEVPHQNTISWVQHRAPYFPSWFLLFLSATFLLFSLGNLICFPHSLIPSLYIFLVVLSPSLWCQSKSKSTGSLGDRPNRR